MDSVSLANGEDAWPAYGFGFNLTEMRGHRVAEHAGASGTFLLHVIDTPMSVIVLTNLDASGGPNAGAIARMTASMYDTSLAAPRPRQARNDPSPATTLAIEQLLSDLSQGHDSPVMTASHRSFYAALPTPNRDGLARQLASRSPLAFLADDDVSSHGIRITDPVRHIAYYRATVDGASLYFTFYLTPNGKVAQMRLSPQ